MVTDDIKSELLAAIVEGPFEDPLWNNFLGRLREVTKADFVGLTCRPPSRPFEEEITLLSAADGELTIESVDIDEFPGEPPADERLVEGRPYSFAELEAMGDPQVVAYLSYIREKGISHVRQIRVREASGVHGWLTISRSGNQDFTEQDDALLRDIARVLRSALRAFVALEREKFNAMLTAEPTRRLHFGWLLLDRAGTILDCDEQGAQALQSGVLRRLPNGSLSAGSRKLEKEVLSAIEQIAGDARSRPRAITLSQEPWLDMLLIPTRSKSISAKAAPAVIAYIHGDSWKSADRCEQLAQLFRLSPQESRLALALCRGMTMSEAAADLELAVGTARNYAKAIFAKTGARGQPDLVRILMRSVLAVAPDL